MLAPPLACSGLRDLKVSAGRRPPPFHLDAGRRNVEHLAGLVFREDARDVIVHDDHLIDVSEPLLGEHADRRRAAADAHPLLADAVDDRGGAGFDHDRDAAIDGQFNRPAVREASSASQVTRPSFFEPPVR